MNWNEVENNAWELYETYRDIFGIGLVVITWPIWGPIVMFIGWAKRRI